MLVNILLCAYQTYIWEDVEFAVPTVAELLYYYNSVITLCFRTPFVFEHPYLSSK